MPYVGGRVRVAVVGTGGVATGQHVPALRACRDQVDLVAAVDPDPARLAEFRAAVGEEIAGYADLHVMLTAQRPDLVVIATPPALHRAQTLTALSAGAWVWCEKPLCLSLAEFDELSAAERAGGPYVSVVFQHRYGSGAAHARSLIESGELGRPLLAHCQTTWYRDAAYYAVPWRGRWASEGGGPSMGHGIHQMDLLLHLLGDWVEVRAMAGRLVHDVESEDVSTALVRFASGAVATVVNSVISPQEVSRIRIDTTEATMELTHLYGYRNQDWVYTPRPGLADDPEGMARIARWRTPPGNTPSSHAAQLPTLIAAMRAGERPPGSGVDARRTLEFIAAMYKAAFEGGTVHPGDITPNDPFYSAMHGDHAGWLPASMPTAKAGA